MRKRAIALMVGLTAFGAIASAGAAQAEAQDVKALSDNRPYPITIHFGHVPNFGDGRYTVDVESLMSPNQAP